MDSLPQGKRHSPGHAGNIPLDDKEVTHARKTRPRTLTLPPEIGPALRPGPRVPRIPSLFVQDRACLDLLDFTLHPLQRHPASCEAGQSGERAISESSRHRLGGPGVDSVRGLECDPFSIAMLSNFRSSMNSRKNLALPRAFIGAKYANLNAWIATQRVRSRHSRLSSARVEVLDHRLSWHNAVKKPCPSTRY